MNLTGIFKNGLFRQIFLYGVIGAISAGLDSLIFYILHTSLNVFVTNAISVNVGMTVSFTLNTFLNFKKSDKLAKRALSFFSIGYFGLLLSMLILYLGINVFDFQELNTKIFSIFIIAAIQYLLNKFITYSSMENIRSFFSREKEYE